MKNMKLCAILIFAFITLTNAQWLETTIAVGSGPGALVYDPTNNKVYCANRFSDNVTVIDGATNAVITTIVVGSGPEALVYNPTNNKVYCANYDSHNVTVIDGATNAVITTITVGDRPFALVYNPTNNKVYCANYYSDNVTVIDGATNAVITTIAVGDEPWAFAWNHTQNRTYVANGASSSISVIRDVTGIEEDRKQNTSRLTLQISPNPAKTFFIIHSPAAVQSVKIYDVLGKLIRAEDLAEFNDEKKISLKGISSGVYFLKVNTEDTVFIKKLIVTK